MKDSWKTIAEMLADKLIEIEQEVVVETKQENDLWWARFLKSQEQVRLWRKGIVARYMLIEERCE